MTDFASLFRLLAQHNIEFILVGGAAATAYGSTRLTQDLESSIGALLRTSRAWLPASRPPSIVIGWTLAWCSTSAVGKEVAGACRLTRVSQ